jgi:lysophospholipase L1-like esterase
MLLRLAPLALAFVACVHRAPETRAKEPERPAAPAAVVAPQPALAPAPVTVALPEERVAFVGHFDARDPAAPRFAWPATEVALAFEGDSLHVELTDTPLPDEQPETDWLSIEIDDQPPRKLALREGRHTYEVASGLGGGRHELRLRKRTEPEVGTVTLHGFRLPHDGKLLDPPEPAKLRIEVIGDSISAGYGNEGPNEQCHFSAETEDATRTYATVAARELEADVTVVAWSGKGVTRNFEVDEPETMADVFDRVLPSDAAAPRPHARPHVLVVNLGANDFVRGIPGKNTFITRYEALLSGLFARSPDARLALLVPPLLADDHPQKNARSILRAYLHVILKGQKARGRTAILVEQYLKPEEGLGCDYHPSLASHERLGKELAETLRPLIKRD